MLSALVLALSPLALPENGWVAFEQPAVTGLSSMGCGDDGKASLHESMEYWGERSNASDDTYERFTMFVEFNDNQPRSLRAYTPDCEVDGASDARLLIRLDSAEAVALIADWVKQDISRSFTSRAIATLAHIDHADVDFALGSLAADIEHRKVSHDALFWLAQRRGDTGREIVVQHLEDHWPLEHRKQALMALALSKHSAVLEIVRQQARSAGNGDMRAHAVTALGISQAPGALADLHSIFLVEQDRTVREQVLFALAQLKSPDAADILVDIARDPEYGEHRRTALFWLANMKGSDSEQRLDELLGELL